MSDVIVIGVAGGTGSGKTTLVKALINRFGDNISVLSHDNYYKRHDEMSYEERTHLNYDCPDAFDTDMMIGHLRQLKAGQAIDCPTYDYTIHNRADEVLHIEPRKVIVVEGFAVMYGMPPAPASRAAYSHMTSATQAWSARWRRCTRSAAASSPRPTTRAACATTA